MSSAGPHWLTGGKVGPEASVLTLITFSIAAIVFTRFNRQNRYQISMPRGQVNPSVSRVEIYHNRRREND
jgi:hypothetical protein